LSGQPRNIRACTLLPFRQNSSLRGIHRSDIFLNLMAAKAPHGRSKTPKAHGSI